MTSHPDTPRALMAGVASVVALFTIAFALPAYFLLTHSKQGGATESAYGTVDRAPFERVATASQRSSGSTRAADEELAQRITKLIDGGELRSAR